MDITESDIRGGPEKLESKLSHLLKPAMDKGERLRIFKIVIDEMQKQYGANEGRVKMPIAFSLGYLYHESARCSNSRDVKILYWRQALGYYEHVIEHRRNREEVFYACYSLGMLLQNVDEGWSKAEEKYLLAYELFPERGEPILKIIMYYQMQKQWAIAYLFSRFACDKFYNKIPKDVNWGFDKSAYGWQLLDLHKVSCYNLGKMDEATLTFTQIYDLVAICPDKFQPEEIEKINSQRNLFPEAK
jgi:tetratricopeptide (TPR) repeat protein